jgi:predicted Zn-dependent peptidase
MTTLSNGVRVITEAMPHVRSVSVGIWIGSGSRRETGDYNGISHFIEHMLFKGTTRRSAEDIARSVDSIGGNLDAFTAKELVCFNTKVLDEHLSQAFDVLADLVLHPMFRDEDIEKEKGVILEEIKMEADSPDYLVHEIFSANFWKDHALGKPILGTPQTVKRFDQDMIRSFYSAVYAPSNLVGWWPWLASTWSRCRRVRRRRPITSRPITRASRSGTRRRWSRYTSALAFPPTPYLMSSGSRAMC